MSISSGVLILMEFFVFIHRLYKFLKKDIGLFIAINRPQFVLFAVIVKDGRRALSVDLHSGLDGLFVIVRALVQGSLAAVAYAFCLRRLVGHMINRAALLANSAS